MEKLRLITLFILGMSNLGKTQTYNTLKIPEAKYGSTFNLIIKDTFKQLRSGNQTITGAVNDNFWGPTLFLNKGDVVQMNVENKLNESTTLHWHGLHLPAVMDGGPHQVIPTGTIWQPYWTVKNNAGTYWYHPHLHEMTLDHVTKGIGGLIIVRDAQESALALPRTYGVDDIPVALTSRSYDASNQFLSKIYGDNILVNGTPSAQVSLPKQMVRLRLLNAEIARGYNLGFSDNRTFYIIANDGGLLNTPLATTRVQLMNAERLEILVNLNDLNIGAAIDLKAYNSGQPNGFPGSESALSTLNNRDFNLLHIVAAATTANPITAVPSTLASNSYWTSSQATVQRTINVTDGVAEPFSLDNVHFDLNTINKTVNLDAIEKWTIVNSNIVGHTFHIHDVQFKIVERNGSAAQVGAHEAGWKDVVYVPLGESASFVAKFEDYADASHPFMYHCHFLNHEDEGMMGQFVVTSSALPIDLQFFTGKIMDDKNILNWQTANENGSSKGFEVQRSGSDRVFQTIGFVAPKGKPSDYSFTDETPLSISYYRLRQQDADGKQTFSKTLSLAQKGANRYAIFPNPTTDRLFIQSFEPRSTVYYVSVSNLHGKVVLMLPQPDLQYGIDLSRLAKGVYFVHITDKESKAIQVFKVVKI